MFKYDYLCFRNKSSANYVYLLQQQLYNNNICPRRYRSFDYNTYVERNHREFDVKNIISSPPSLEV